MRPPEISVVIPLHNKAADVARCLRSVHAQTCAAHEILVVDDGSSDGSYEAARTALGYNGRIISQEHRGVGAARNRGIAEATALYIAFLDADDEWHPEFLQAMHRLTARYPSAGLYATGYRTVWPNGKAFDTTLLTNPESITCLVRDYFARRAVPSLVTSSSVMIRKSVFTQVGQFLEDHPLGEDGEFWARVAYRYPVAYDRRILSTYHAGGQASATVYLKPDPKTPPPVIRTLRGLLAAEAYPNGIHSSIRKYLEDWVLFYLWRSTELPRSEFAILLRKELSIAQHFRIQRTLLWVATRAYTPRFVLRFLSRCFRSGTYYLFTDRLSGAAPWFRRPTRVQ